MRGGISTSSGTPRYWKYLSRDIVKPPREEKQVRPIRPQSFELRKLNLAQHVSE